MAGMEDGTKQENGSPKEGELVGGEGQELALIDGQPTQTKASIETTARNHLIQQTHAIILPSYSTWFDMHKINHLEKKALPEYFNSRNRSKTPAVYKDYRDFMINTYRLNPTEYLTVTACRRNLAGDVCAIMRVHSFLEQWGLINYQVDPDARPSVIGPPFTGHFRVVADTPRGLQSFQPAPNSSVTPGKPYAQTDRLLSAPPPAKTDLNMEIRRNIYDSKGKDLTPEPAGEKQANGEGSAANGTPAEGSTKSIEDIVKEPKKVIHCGACGIDCTRVRYHSAKSLPASAGSDPSVASKVRYDICPNCYLEGRYPGSSGSVDFVKLEDAAYSSVPDREAPWSDAETLQLLEGLEMFDKDWNAVADHVGTRSRDECIIKFLQLEIEDNYLDNEPAVNSDFGGMGLLHGRVPFSQADNPVMSVVAYLAGLAEPSVTAAAAGKSIDEMRKSVHKSLAKDPSSDKSKGKQPESSTTKSDDTMDIDHSTETVSDDRSKKSSDPLVTVPLATGAARADTLSSHEERVMTSLVSATLNASMQKLNLKLEQFNEMEAVLQAERRDLEKARQQLFLDRLAFKQRVNEVELGMRIGGDQGMDKLANASKAAEKLGFGFEDVTSAGGAVMPVVDSVDARQLEI
jgi:SWI/SNF related-matrix-associated actin-dependent regulator of chromatin subfamily C